MVCSDCEVVKLIRSKHCEICRRCCIVYDHHCPWVNNCIGAKNYGRFYLFILSLAINMMLSLLFFFLGNEFEQNKAMRKVPKIHAHWYAYLIVSISLTIGCTFLLPLLGLLYIHTKNIFQGITTYERFTFKGKQTSSFINNNLDETPENKDQLLIQQQSTIQSQQSLLAATVSTSWFDNVVDMCYRNARKYRPTPQVVAPNTRNSSQIQIQDEDTLSV